MGQVLGSMTSRNPTPNKGIESKMAASDVEQDLSTPDDLMKRSVTPRRVSQALDHGKVASGPRLSPPSLHLLPSFFRFRDVIDIKRGQYYL